MYKKDFAFPTHFLLDAAILPLFTGELPEAPVAKTAFVRSLVAARVCLLRGIAMGTPG